MESNNDVISWLNTVLKNELTAVNQYLLHARMLQDWGLEGLGAREHEESMDEMRHADTVLKRILFLQGRPELGQLGKLLVGETTKEILKNDLRLEEDGCSDLKKAIKTCETEGDYSSRALLIEILQDEEKHVDHLRTALSLIDRIGLQNYERSQIKPTNGH